MREAMLFQIIFFCLKNTLDLLNGFNALTQALLSCRFTQPLTILNAVAKR